MSKDEEIVGKPISDAIGGEMAEEKEAPKRLSRKDFVKGAAVVAGAGALASCAPAATPAPEAAPTCPPAEECPPCPTPAAAGEAVDVSYEVHPPYGVPTMAVRTPVPRLDTLEGKTICGFGTSFHGAETFPVIGELLKKKYPTATFIGQDTIGEDEYGKEAFLEAIPDIIEEFGCDAVMVGNGC